MAVRSKSCVRFVSTTACTCRHLEAPAAKEILYIANPAGQSLLHVFSEAHEAGVLVHRPGLVVAQVHAVRLAKHLQPHEAQQARHGCTACPSEQLAEHLARVVAAEVTAAEAKASCSACVVLLRGREVRDVPVRSDGAGAHGGVCSSCSSLLSRLPDSLPGPALGPAARHEPRAQAQRNGAVVAGRGGGARDGLEHGVALVVGEPAARCTRVEDVGRHALVAELGVGVAPQPGQDGQLLVLVPGDRGEVVGVALDPVVEGEVFCRGRLVQALGERRGRVGGGRVRGVGLVAGEGRHRGCFCGGCVAGFGQGADFDEVGEGVVRLSAGHSRASEIMSCSQPTRVFPVRMLAVRIVGDDVGV
ncbi:hypothetical protein F5883DRAFT_595158 [Diaporthe sp. PMI_573]|nr:hypothetical protein F5883DRAFT_595158 [Diaporthaceae sp. PMI_573]